MLFCFFGHHKAATTFIDQVVLRAVCRTIGLRRYGYNSEHSLGGSSSINAWIAHEKIDFLSVLNSDRQIVDQINVPLRGFHVIRDPRDVIVSGYFSHRYSHSVKDWPELVAHREKLQTDTLEDGLLREIDFSLDLQTNGICLHPLTSMGSWNYKSSNILELRYEDMVGRTHDFFRQVFDFLGIVKPAPMELTYKITNRLGMRPFLPSITPCITRSKLNACLDACSFQAVSGGRQLGQVDLQHHYRKGLPGEWKTLFTEPIKLRFKFAYPGLVTKLGYETSENW